MVIKEKPKELNFPQSSETEIISVWEDRANDNTILWSKRDDKLEKKNTKRNLKIAIIREPFLNQTKERGHNYERKGNYLYKSEEHHKQFLEIIQAAGLNTEPKPEPKPYPYPYDIDGFCHYNVSIPKRRITAEHYPTKLELSIIENRNMSELGGMEVQSSDL